MTTELQMALECQTLYISTDNHNILYQGINKSPIPDSKASYDISFNNIFCETNNTPKMINCILGCKLSKTYCFYKVQKLSSLKQYV